MARLLNIGEAELARRIAGFGDHAAFCRESLNIRDKFGEKVPLDLYPAQRKLVEAIAQQEAIGQPVRGVVLKGRQTRISVAVASELFKRLAFLPGQQGLSVADSLDHAANIFEYVQQFDASYQTFRGVRKLETVRTLAPAINRAGYVEWAGSSKLSSQSAASGAAGRSRSRRALHLSEFAFFKNATEYMTGVMPSVPSDPFTFVIVESTANGVGGEFYELCQTAMNPSVRSGWFFQFVAWFEDPGYVRPVEPHMEWTREERELAQRHSLKPEQLAWRRWAIHDKCSGSTDLFHQEFPSTAEEAFLTSGRPRFCHISLGRMPVQRDPVAGELEEVQQGPRKRVQFLPSEDEKGVVRIWKMPVPGRRYAIGSDPSKGIDVGVKSGKSDPDYWVAHVLDAETGDQVAVARERLAPYPAADYTAVLGRFYNHAFLVPEANELGFIEALVQVYPLELLYRRSPDADDKRPPTLHEIGWLTGTNKPQLISMLDAAIRNGALILRDPVTVQELRTFVWKASGAQEAQEGCHDDCAIALALANVGLNAMPRWKPATQQTEQAPRVIDLRGRNTRWPQR